MRIPLLNSGISVWQATGRLVVGTSLVTGVAWLLHYVRQQERTTIPWATLLAVGLAAGLYLGMRSYRRQQRFRQVYAFGEDLVTYSHVWSVQVLCYVTGAASRYQAAGLPARQGEHLLFRHLAWVRAVCLPLQGGAVGLPCAAAYPPSAPAAPTNEYAWQLLHQQADALRSMRQLPGGLTLPQYSRLLATLQQCIALLQRSEQLVEASAVTLQARAPGWRSWLLTGLGAGVLLDTEDVDTWSGSGLFLLLVSVLYTLFALLEVSAKRSLQVLGTQPATGYLAASIARIEYDIGNLLAKSF